ncbi:hypothetical protein [Sphingomonas sp.]|jgi:hypothetical protein|uniref:hypothetical protein n=1 Tax=Sphingomonas sp. TaxID=28214 RepID=UPI002ED9DCE1
MTDNNSNDARSDLEQAVQSRSDEADAAKGGATTSPLDQTGIDDGVSGSRGEVKNQDVAQQ